MSKPHAAAGRAINDLVALGIHAKNETARGIGAETITEKYAPLVEAARDISQCGFNDIDPRMKYIEVQVSRQEWKALQDALKGVCGE